MAKIHIHTKYSLLDSIIEPEELVKKVNILINILIKEQDGDKAALCVTEHGNVYSNVEVYKLCKKYGVKYLYGCEMYICEDVNIKDKSSKYNHLVVIAKNETGRLNLNKLISESCKYKYYGKPRIDFNLLNKYKDGLVILSACMAGEVQRALMANDKKLAKNIIKKYVNMFGDDYYLEYQSHSEPTQQSLNRQIVDLANELNVKYATNILVVILSLIVGVAGTGVYYVLFSIEFNAINIVCMPLMGLATAVGSMVGYDKVIQTIEQLKNKF